MTQLSHAPDQRAVTVAKTLAGLAILAALAAAAAGLLVILTDPAAGSTAEAALGFVAAVAGLSTAVLVVAAAIYTQVRGLWQYIPSWVRIVTWALLVAAVVFALFRSTGA